MGQTEVLKVFIENPSKDFHAREIAKAIKMSKTAVLYHINKLLKQKLIIKVKKGVFSGFRADETSELYRFYKRQEFLKKLIETGLLDYLEQELRPKCIILFGSFAKAEYSGESDIDLFVQSKESKISLDKFEKKLGHSINIIFEENLNKISPELFNNIINGIKLRGYAKIK